MSVGMLLPLLVADLVLFVVVFADLHEAWLAKDSYFFSVLVLTIVSSLWYLLASVIDPGILPKAPLDKKLLATFKSKALAAGILKVSGSGLLEASLEDNDVNPSLHLCPSLTFLYLSCPSNCLLTLKQSTCFSPSFYSPTSMYNIFFPLFHLVSFSSLLH